MKTATLARNKVSTEMVCLISRLVGLIPWPERCRTMGDVLLLDGKHRVAENVLVGRGGQSLKLASMNFKPALRARTTFCMSAKQAA